MPFPNPYPGKKRTGGRETVNYVNVKGQKMDAVVTGGTGTSLNLFIPSYPKATRRKTGIAKRTSINQTNVWHK